MNACLDRKSRNINRFAAWLSAFELREQQWCVLFALYADKNVINERDIDAVARALNMSATVVRRHQCEGLEVLEENITQEIFKSRFTGGQILPAAQVAVVATAGAESPAVNVDESYVITPTRQILTAVEHLVLSLTYKEDGKVRSDEEIMHLIKDHESIRRKKKFTKHLIDNSRRSASRKLRDDGISVWHCFADHFADLDAKTNANNSLGQLPHLSPGQEALHEKIDLLLSCLTAEQIKCLRHRCDLRDGLPKATEEILAALVKEGGAVKDSKLGRRFRPINMLLQKHEINLWTVVMAYTNGDPTILVAEKRVVRPVAAIIPDDGDLCTFRGIKFGDIENEWKLSPHQLKVLQARWDTESGKPLTSAEIASKLAVSVSNIADQLETISEQMQNMGLSLWHYVAASLTVFPQYSLRKLAPGECPPKPVCKPPFIDEMASILQTLGPAQLFVVQCRSQLDCQGRPKPTKAIEAILNQGRTLIKKRRTVQDSLHQFNVLLKKEGINVWTLLVAATDGNPELIVRTERSKPRRTGVRGTW